MNLIKNGFLFTALALTLVAAGCVSGSYNKGANTADALQSTANAVTAVSTSTVNTLGAMNNLVFHPQSDLRPPYDAYVTAVKNLKTAAVDLDGKVADVQFRSQIYLNNWSNQLTNIQNTDIRARSAARYADVSDKLQSVTNSYSSVKDSLRPFTADLTDIQTALGTDLTAGGLDSVKDVVNKTKVDAVPLRTSIKKLQADFSRLSAALSPVSAEDENK
jgi:PBP1b-binding outer membrane lipoprotein LpoB